MMHLAAQNSFFPQSEWALQMGYFAGTFESAGKVMLMCVMNQEETTRMQGVMRMEGLVYHTILLTLIVGFIIGPVACRKQHTHTHTHTL